MITTEQILISKQIRFRAFHSNFFRSFLCISETILQKEKHERKSNADLQNTEKYSMFL